MARRGDEEQGARRGRPRRRRIVGTALAGLLGASIVACGHARTAPDHTTTIAPAVPLAPEAHLPSAPLSPSTDDVLPASIVEQLQPLSDYPLQLGVPGAITVVDVRGVGAWTAVGGRSAAAADSAPITVDSTFNVGSITKTFTATAVLRLIADGQHDLMLARTLSSFETVPDLPYDNAITVAQLLQHVSGVADYAANPAFVCVVTLTDGCQQAWAPTTEWEPSDLVDLAAEEDPFGPPGAAGYHYSNTNYVILGMIIEEVTGRSAEAVITDLVIEPLGLDSTTFPVDQQAAEAALTTRPSLVLFENGQVAQTLGTDVLNPSAYWTAGAITSTATDLATWAHDLAEGTLLPLDLQLLRLRTLPIGSFSPLPGFPGNPVDAGYGLGIAAFGDFLGHNGAVPEYQSIAVYDPYRKAVVVMLLNAWVIEVSGEPLTARLDEAIPTALLPSFIAVLESSLLPPVE